MSQINLAKIYRYPFKGFSGQQIASTDLEPGRGIAHDRRYAITNGTVNSGEWAGPRNFFINAVNDGMQKFTIDYREQDHFVRLQNTAGIELAIDLNDPASIDQSNAMLAEFMQPVGVAGDLPPPQIVERQGDTGYWDYTDTPISLINLATVERVAERIGQTVNPERFRGNLLISGLPAWQEFDLLGRKIIVGDAELEVIRPINRCPATSVDPGTGDRNIDMPSAFQDHFGHVYCGMYAKVVKSGAIRELSPISIAGDAVTDHQEACTEKAPNYALWPRTVKVTGVEKGSNSTIITLASNTPWPLPEAAAGQRLRLHLDHPGWAIEEITDASGAQYRIEVTDSPTGDPVTNWLRNELGGEEILTISGPYGKPR